MRFCYFYLGLCLGVSSAWASNVQLDSGNSYKNIRAALDKIPAANKTNPHTLKFVTAAVDDDENNNSAGQGPSVVDISDFGSLTIEGVNSGITTISGGGASLFYSSSDKNLTLKGLTIQSFASINWTRSNGSGGAIGLADGKSLTLNATGPVTFDGHHADSSGGAISASSVTISGVGPVVFSNNNSTYSDAGAVGGAIAGFNTLNVSGDVTFTNNTANKGGAIFSAAQIDLTDTHFTGNGATYEGGAIYLASQPIQHANGQITYSDNSNVNFTVTAGKKITLNPDARNSNTGALRTSNNNDIACAYINDTGATRRIFTKKGPGTLVLNTNNGNWRGRTVVEAGEFIIGVTSNNSDAVWGTKTSNPGTSITVKANATIGGYGTINGGSLTFEADSIWRLFPTGSGFNLAGGGSGTITFDAGMKVQLGTLPTDSFAPDGYIVAKCRGLTGSPDPLAPLNQQLDQYNLELTYSYPELGLKKKPKTNIFTFVVPAKYPDSGQWLTDYNQGLMIRYGAPRVGGNQNFFTGETPEIALKNDKLESLLKADNTISSGDTTVTPSWSWIGSVALPVGQTYAWQLRRTTNYGGLSSNGWIAQGTNLSTDPTHLNTILQITPGEGGEY
ncbi:hypothetical protein [Candidatus Finniella inopinata]|uniref:Right-handed parallel beta-helix repeat-containing protein n=1 Tax=Candidatus Finniella inopinata TaxID=1696036 RepID=A0A4Q7DI33_9PROT|nr:hypothetical protein [Candidatus Finniella inopinata]RZI45829.1 hypothetical protein EQU50_05180 [Candidatus Finniella inopinata]